MILIKKVALKFYGVGMDIRKSRVAEMPKMQSNYVFLLFSAFRKYTGAESEENDMEVKDVLKNLRERNHLTQDQMAERAMVTRQAVSRWETGETQPSIDTLQILSREFNVSINTLLGSPRQLICQCCGMPMSEDDLISMEKDGSFNEEYCKWCYADGKYAYDDMDKLIDVCIKHMANESFPEEQARSYMRQVLPKLNYWKGKI